MGGRGLRLFLKIDSQKLEQASMKLSPIGPAVSKIFGYKHTDIKGKKLHVTSKKYIFIVNVPEFKSLSVLFNDLLILLFFSVLLLLCAVTCSSK